MLAFKFFFTNFKNLKPKNLKMNLLSTQHSAKGLFLASGLISLIPSIASAKGEANQNKVKEQQQPNVVIIFTDDQGYADLGCFGSPTNKTPVLDNFCLEGTSFSNFYAQPVSGSSRSAILTGRYPLRSGGSSMHASEVTFAELARTVGYQTVCIGKWDVSNRKPLLDQMPCAQGFDYYYGPLGANDVGGITLYENNDLIGRYTDMGSLLKLYTDKSIEYLTEQRDPEKPFVLYLAHTMMHTILDASEEFKGKSAGGLYGDVVEEFDYHTGRLLSTLDQLGLTENTIIIYTTDNGPWNQTKYTQNEKFNKKYEPGTIFWGDGGELRAGKGSAYEGGSRVQCIIKWEGHIAKGRRCDGLISTLDFMPTFANLLGYEIPKDIRIDGVDQTDMILGKTKKSARTTFAYSQHNLGVQELCAIRDGRWKLLLPGREIETVYLMDFGTNDYELYDLKNDISETTNLASKYPKIVERLKAELESIY